jgi:hypothetical protein
MSSTKTPLPLIQAHINQEIGVMVGFIAIFGLVLATFAVMWRSYNKKQAEKEEVRKRELVERGFGMKGNGLEKEKGRGTYFGDGVGEQVERI